jgi:hypothetical protein
MYITENQTVGDSVLFLLSARRTLAEMVLGSDSKNADALNEFLVNEASDYEIMSLLVDGKLPDEKYNTGHEAYLFSNLKEACLMQAAVLVEAMGQQTFTDFMTKVDLVYPAISTQSSVLEFFAAQDRSVLIATLLEAGETATGETMKRLAAAKEKTGRELMQGREIPGADTSIGAKVGKGWEALQGWLKSAADSASDVATKYAPKAQAMAAGPGGWAVGGAALAALLAYASVKTYKRFLSKAAKSCAGASGAAKSACMQHFKSKAKAAQAADLSRAATACAKTKNPAACKAAIQRKIAALR